jgi:hypothetical protein
MTDTAVPESQDGHVLRRYTQIGSYGRGLMNADAPAVSGFAITPSDSVDLAVTTRGLLVGGAGDVKVDFEDIGTGVVLPGLLAGVVYPFCIKRVYLSSTSATNLVGLY